MPNAKVIKQGYSITGSTVYCIIRRDADSYQLNDATGAFANAPADPYVSLTEHAVMLGFYELSESRTSWDDGAYTIAVYAQSGGSPSPAADTLIGLSTMYVDADAEITSSSLLSAISATGPAAVWEELLAAHTTAGSMGKVIYNANLFFGLAA